MPFPMVHLSIALRILKNSSEISDPKKFVLGSIAPDSVHFRPNFDRRMKNLAHLRIDDDEYPNISEWCDSVYKFLEMNKQSENIDFIYGYCSHVLADIRNTMLIYMPFRMEHCNKNNSEIINDYMKECADIDNELFHMHEDRDKIHKFLKESNGIDIYGLVNAEDQEKMKFHILYEQYAKRASCFSYSYKYVTLERINDFIDNEAGWIRERLFATK